MESMPVFISYPRSGSNWINSAMEVYFNRPRLRRGITFLGSEAANQPPMWFHDHDYWSKLQLKHNNILYLYRNPDDVIFSSLKSEYNGDINDKNVDEQIVLLRNNLSKYLVKSRAKVIIKYEYIKADLTEFQKFVSWLKPKAKIDMGRISNINKTVNKKDVVARSADKRFFGPKLLSSTYEDERKAFKKQYGNRILSSVITPELKKFF